ncbi:MAG: glycosyltransferase [Bacteroidales bacterium]|nr:glycosyltransferase [Bacteroidales bacterium]
MIHNNEPLVSVCMITYNHEPYIRQAIESVLMQQCTVSYELVIGEDCSSDGTGAICREYASSHPNVRLLPPENNLGMLPNFFRTMEACSGKYIAFCEGDDYWTDPQKLQKQADFLEKHTESGMVCTDYSKLFQNDAIIRRNCFKRAGYRNEVRFNDYLTDMSTIGTATVMARKELITAYLAETDQETRNRFYVGDSPLWLFIAARSGIAVLHDETAVYRILDSSACHITSDTDHYRFVMNGLSTADYFVSRYGNNDPALADKIEQKRLKATLFHAFKTMDKTLAGITRGKMKKYQPELKRRLWSRLMLIGSGNMPANSIITYVLKLLRQGIGLRKKELH